MQIKIDNLNFGDKLEYINEKTPSIILFLLILIMLQHEINGTTTMVKNEEII